MNLPLHELARTWLARDQAAVVVEVAATQGSAPRAAGTRMLVGLQQTAGSIGGGHLELMAIEAARSLLRRGGATDELRLALGPALGQCCGGSVVLRLQRLGAQALAGWDAPPARFVLQLHGAGHVGRAIAHLLEGIACRVQWVDERDDAFPAGPGAAHIERLHTEQAAAEVAQAPAGACFLVLTHSHDLDLAITEAVLRRDDFRFLGLIGSRTKRGRFMHRLRARGMAEPQLERVVCPIGLPGIAGKEPEVIAVAVVAQLLGLAHEG